MNIQPTTSVSLPLNGEVNQLEITVDSFNLFPSQVTVTWKVIGNTVGKEGTIVLPQHILDAWGTDDTVVENYVLSELGLVKTV